MSSPPIKVSTSKSCWPPLRWRVSTSRGRENSHVKSSFDVLLDTNIISEVRKGQRPDPKVSTWYAGVSKSQLFISSLTVGEIRRGVELARRRGDVDQAETLESWLQTVIERFSGRILAMDIEEADVWGQDIRHSSGSRG